MKTARLTPLALGAWIVAFAFLSFGVCVFSAHAQTEPSEDITSEIVESEETPLDIFVPEEVVVTPPSITLLEEEVPAVDEETNDASTSTTSTEEALVVIEESNNSSESAAIVTTEKDDYHPGETANIFGAFFAPLETFLVKVFGRDENDANYTETETEVTADEDGAFSLSYVLDSLYRPFYEVVVSTLSGDKVAETYFRDAAVAAYNQCENDDGDGYSTGNTGCQWGNGGINAQNSTYYEGDSTPQRVWLNGFVPGSTHTVTIQYGTTKGGHHAYDFLTSWNASEDWITLPDLCESIDGCTTASVGTFPVPHDANGSGQFESTVTKRDFTIRGGQLTAASNPLKTGSYTGDSETSITLSFTVDSTGSMCKTEKVQGKDETSCGIAIFFGAHVAETNDWEGFNGTTGAGSINGAPYHVALTALDGASIGNRDNQMQAGTIVVPPNEVGTIIIRKETTPDGDTTDFSFNPSWSDTDFTLSDGEQYESGELNTGVYTVSETLPLGWDQVSAVCSDGSPVSAIDLAANETVICTFTNAKRPTLTLVKTVINDNGGTAVTTDFQAKIDGNNVAWGAAQTLTTGAHTASETSLPTYSAGAWGGDCASNGSITLAYGENKTCTITNDDLPASISGMKFEDKNGNGVKDVGDTGLSGWTIFIDENGNNELDGDEVSTVTDANGAYSFSDLSTGSYVIREVQQSGWTQTTANPTTIELENGENVTDINFGNFKLVSISGKKYNDDEGDGAITGDATLSGWTVRLYKVVGAVWTLVDTKVTDGTGSYTFTNLPLGSYRTCEVLQNGWIQTFSSTASANASPDADAEGAECNARTVSTSGANPAAGNFGNYQVKALTVEKTAETSYTRTFTWTIEKTVSPSTLDLFEGDSADVEYTVALAKDGGTDSAFAVEGSITITNPNPVSTGLDAVVTSVTDEMTGGIEAEVECPSDTVPAGGSLVCTYASTLPDGTGRTNTATVETAGIVDGGSDDVSVAFDLENPTNTVNDTVHVEDTNGSSWTFSGDGTQSYSDTFTCDADEGKHDNTVTIEETDQSDTATVTVNCHDLEVTKTAATSYVRTFDWDIEKTVDQSVVDLFTGSEDTVTYTVTATKDSGTDSDFAVSGGISVHNPAPVVATLVSVSDAVSGVIDPLTVDCGVSFPYVLAAGATLECTYEGDLPNKDARTNTATVVLQNSPTGTTNYTGSAAVTFGAPTTLVNDTVTMTDTYEDSSVTETNTTKEFTYDRVFSCQADEGSGTGAGTYPNTATIVETKDSAEASVTINCYDLAVSKTVNTSYTKTWTWTVEKVGDTNTVTLAPGQTYPVNYEVTVDASSADSAWAATGIITITNPAPIDATLSEVTDMLTGDIAATVECPSKTVLAGESLECSYSVALNDATPLTNTAVATLINGTSYSGTAEVSFTNAVVTEVDESIDLTDSVYGDLGTVAAADAPKSFSYTLDVGPYDGAEQCGTTQQFDNTASFTTNDTDATGSDTWTVDAAIRCTCSLTQGYWKTHNESFHGGAPADDNWFNLGSLAENTIFFLTTKTWYENFWTAPKGNVYYNMAHQYMAAKLNVLNGAYNPTINAELLQAETLLKTYTPAQIAGLKGKNATTVSKQFNDLAAKFAAFNEGATNPAGHCSEIPQ